MLPWNVHPKWSETGNTGVTGHLTQLLWAETEKVGCGFISFVDENGDYNQVRGKKVSKKYQYSFWQAFFAVAWLQLLPWRQRERTRDTGLRPGRKSNPELPSVRRLLCRPNENSFYS